jgi:hypothetical protein
VNEFLELINTLAKLVDLFLMYPHLCFETLVLFLCLSGTGHTHRGARSESNRTNAEAGYWPYQKQSTHVADGMRFEHWMAQNFCDNSVSGR